MAHLQSDIPPIPVVEMEKRCQETVCGDEPEGKFGQKGAHERQANPTEAHLDLHWTLGNLCTTPGSDVYFSRESTGFNDYIRTSIILESLYMLFIFMISLSPEICAIASVRCTIFSALSTSTLQFRAPLVLPVAAARHVAAGIVDCHRPAAKEPPTRHREGAKLEICTEKQVQTLRPTQNSLKSRFHCLTPSHGAHIDFSHFPILMMN